MSAAFSHAVYDRPLAAPFRYGDRTISRRRGVILRRELADEAIYAEASPLPGHSAESLEEILSALENLSSPTHAGRFPPALRFALDSFSTALQPAADSHPVRSNALLAWKGPDATSGDFRAAVDAGYTVFKLKLHPENMPDILEFLRRHRAEGRKFRLDANRSLGIGEARRLFSELGKHDLAGAIDYLEEPLPRSWDEGLSDAPVALAADESLDSPESIFRLLDSRHAPRVFVLKPTVLGALSGLSGIIDELRAGGKRAIVTSAFESEVGRRSLIRFLSRQAVPETHGIATGFLFRRSFLPDRSVFTDVPPVSAAEAEWLGSLSWRECR